MQQQLHDADPFFIVGPVRSGTTVLRLLLGHHPQICRCEEMEFVASALVGQPDWPDAQTYVRALPRWREFRASGYTADPASTFPQIARGFLRQRQAIDGRPLVGATVHNHFDELPRVWPNAKYIHLSRDPRDVARSCVQMGWTGNAWSGTAIWEQAHDNWLRLRGSLPDDHWIELRFEDLISNAEAELHRITRFLNVAYDPAMLDIEKDTTYKRPDPRGSNSWRTSASAREIREIEARLGPRLVQAGYEPSGLPPLQMTPLHRLSLRLGNKLGRMKFAQKRYGIGLLTASMLSRRLPFQRFRDSAQLAVDHIDERYLK